MTCREPHGGFGGRFGDCREPSGFYGTGQMARRGGEHASKKPEDRQRGEVRQGGRRWKKGAGVKALAGQ